MGLSAFLPPGRRARPGFGSDLPTVFPSDIKLTGAHGMLLVDGHPRREVTINGTHWRRVLVAPAAKAPDDALQPTPIH